MDNSKISLRIAKYQEARSNIPPAGCGNNCHTYLLTVANYARIAGISEEQAFTEIREAMPPGKRVVTDREILDAIDTGYYGSDTPCFIPKPKPIISNTAVTFRKLIEPGRGVTETDIMQASPVSPESAPVHVLSALYNPNDLLFIGDAPEKGILGQTIRPCSEWADYFSKGGKTAPHIIPNPLTGQPAQRKNGDGMTFRGDNNVASFRLCVAEFDGLSREDQLSFWAAIDLPIVALIDSGGKSIHGWLFVPKLAAVQTAEEWDRHIRDRLYAQILVPLGVDSACSNSSRLSRLPGHFREDKGRLQRILFLSPDGRKVF